MTLLQVCVRSAEAAQTALAAGADLIAFDWSGRNAAYEAVLDAVSDPHRVHINVGNDSDIPAPTGAWARVALSMTALAAGPRLPPDGMKAVDLVLEAERLDVASISKWASAGVGGVILDTADATRLLDHLTMAALGAVATSCRTHGLRFGLGGALPTPDIGRLLLLAPDVLRLRPSEAALDRDVRMARDLVPRGPSVPDTGVVETDRVFVRDLIVPMSIGAYRGERGRLQRVCFSVEADVQRPREPAKDMRDVFSYDLIIDRIRLIAAEGHIDLVETLAERIADALLAHPRVVETRIRVEKLDVVEARVGIEMSRRRPEASASGHRQSEWPRDPLI